MNKWLTVDQEKWLNTVVQGKWTYNFNGLVDVGINIGMSDDQGDVDCSWSKLTTLPVKFGKILGFFDCSNNKLTSLEGAPHTVGSSFDCSANNLSSLKYSPHVVGGNFDCNSNELLNLRGAPNIAHNNFDCSYNPLNSLVGSPIEISENFTCNETHITTLIGAPNVIHGNFECWLNPQLNAFIGLPVIKGKVRYENNLDNTFNCYIIQKTQELGRKLTEAEIIKYIKQHELYQYVQYLSAEGQNKFNDHQQLGSELNVFEKRINSWEEFKKKRNY